MANMEYLRLTGKSCRTEADRREPTEEPIDPPSLVSSFAFPTVSPVSSLLLSLFRAERSLPVGSAFLHGRVRISEVREARVEKEARSPLPFSLGPSF